VARERLLQDRRQFRISYFTSKSVEARSELCRIDSFRSHSATSSTVFDPFKRRLPSTAEEVVPLWEPHLRTESEISYFDLPCESLEDKNHIVAAQAVRATEQLASLRKDLADVEKEAESLHSTACVGVEEEASVFLNRSVVASHHPVRLPPMETLRAIDENKRREANQRREAEYATNKLSQAFRRLHSIRARVGEAEEAEKRAVKEEIYWRDLQEEMSRSQAGPPPPHIIGRSLDSALGLASPLKLLRETIHETRLRLLLTASQQVGDEQTALVDSQRRAWMARNRVRAAASEG
jgi:hypothetical protein